VGPHHHGLTCLQLVDGGEVLQVWRVVVNIVKSISIVLVCIVFVQLLFISYCLRNGPYEHCYVILDSTFLKVLFSQVDYSEFLVQTHSILKISFQESNRDSNLVFSKYVVAPLINGVWIESSKMYLQHILAFTCLYQLLLRQLSLQNVAIHETDVEC
jgi:hypothetical protein